VSATHANGDFCAGRFLELVPAAGVGRP